MTRSLLSLASVFALSAGCYSTPSGDEPYAGGPSCASDPECGGDDGEEESGSEGASEDESESADDQAEPVDVCTQGAEVFATCCELFELEDCLAPSDYAVCCGDPACAAADFVACLGDFTVSDLGTCAEAVDACSENEPAPSEPEPVPEPEPEPEPEAAGCGWGFTGETNVPEGFVCGGSGDDPSGATPTACPSDIVEGGPCGSVTGIGCCDGAGDVWFCSTSSTLTRQAC